MSTEKKKDQTKSLTGTTLKTVYKTGHHPNSIPKNTKNHPFRKQNSLLQNFTLKSMAEKRKNNLQ